MTVNEFANCIKMSQNEKDQSIAEVALEKQDLFYRYLYVIHLDINTSNAVKSVIYEMKEKVAHFEARLNTENGKFPGLWEYTIDYIKKYYNHDSEESYNRLEILKYVYIDFIKKWQSYDDMEPIKKTILIKKIEKLDIKNIVL